MTIFPFEDKAVSLLSRKENLVSMRHSHDEGFEEIQTLLWPFRGELNTEFLHDGYDRVPSVYDSTGMTSLHNLVNFSKGRLFPPDFPWVVCGPPADFDEAARRSMRIRKAYQTSAERLLHEFSVSNFYDVSTDWVRDITAIGNCATSVEEQNKIGSKRSGFRGFVFDPIDISRIYWQLDRMDNPLFVAVEYSMHGREVLDEFGDPGMVIFDKVLDKNHKGLLERFEIWHVVIPNENHLPNGIKCDTNRPWCSFWIEPKSKQILREGGFNEHPYIIQTWNRVRREWYGNGLGHLIRPDVAGLNSGRAMILEAIEADLLPPLMVEHESVMMYDQSDAATMSVRSSRDGVEPKYLRSGARITDADSIFRQDKDQIRDVMLGDIIGEPDTEPRSAEETIARASRSQLRASTLTEVIKKILMNKVNRCLDMMVRRGALPELVEVMEETGNDKMDIQFVSPFFTLQKSTVSQNTLSFAAAIKELASVKPNVADRVNYDNYAKILADLFNVPVDMLHDDEVFTEKRVADARAAALQQQLSIAGLARPQAQTPTPQLPLVGA